MVMLLLLSCRLVVTPAHCCPSKVMMLKFKRQVEVTLHLLRLDGNAWAFVCDVVVYVGISVKL